MYSGTSLIDLSWRYRVNVSSKITIIGGSGFVGTNLCQKLRSSGRDFEIVDLNLSKKFPEYCKIGDVRDIKSLRETITGNVVVNLAAVHRDDIIDKNEYEQTNVTGSENIVKVCTEKGIKKIVFTSSVAVYGFADPGSDETGKINPFNEYGRTKYYAEEKLRLWQSAGDNSLIIIRPTVIFGEGNRGNVFNLFNQIYLGRFFMVGKGRNKKSLAYIGNVVAFLETSIDADINYGLFNYSDQPDLSMNELVSEVRLMLKGKGGVGIRIPYWLGLALGYGGDLITKLTGKACTVSSIRVKKFISSTEFKSSNITRDFFLPPFTLRDGIIKTLESEFLSPDPDREIFFTE